MAIIKETLQNGMKPPYLIMCMSPHAKESLLKHQNLSVGALSEPNINEKNILADLNITIEEFFRKYTFKLNEDYYLYITFWSYEKEGWKGNKTKLSLGEDNKIKVHLTTIADPWYFWKGSCTSKAHKPVTLSGNATFTKV